MTTEEEYLIELRTSACGFDHDEIRAEATRIALEGVVELQGLREALMALPTTMRWPNMKRPGDWYCSLEDVLIVVEERAREAQAGSRSVRSSAALLSPTPASGEDILTLTTWPGHERHQHADGSWCQRRLPASGEGDGA